MSRKSGEGRAHHDGRGRQCENREGDAQECERERRSLQAWIQAAIEVVDQPERNWGDDHHPSENELEDPVHPQGRCHPIRDATTNHAADGDTAEEAGKDRGYRLGGIPEYEDKLAGPHDFVDERSSSGQDENQEDHGRPTFARRGSHRPGRSFSWRSWLAPRPFGPERQIGMAAASTANPFKARPGFAMVIPATSNNSPGRRPRAHQQLPTTVRRQRGPSTARAGDCCR